MSMFHFNTLKQIVKQERNKLCQSIITYCDCGQQVNTQIHQSWTVLTLMVSWGQGKFHSLVTYPAVLLDTCSSNHDGHFAYAEF